MEGGVMVDLIRDPGVGGHGVIRNKNLILEVNSERLGVFHTCISLMWFAGSYQGTFRYIILREQVKVKHN